MKNILLIIGIVLLVLWAVGYLGFGAAVGSFIHILLVVAVILLLLRLIRG